MIRIAHTSEIPAGECKYVVAGGIDYAVAHVDGEFFVVDNDCPHQGAPLGDGFLDGHLITCSLHAWQFDVRSGAMPGQPKICVKTYPVQIIDGEICIEAR